MANYLSWSERALKEYKDLLDYLLEEWGEDIKIRVNSELFQSLVRIQSSPEQFPVILKKKRIRRCVASSQTSIYFKKNGNAIELYSFFDNRQNPKKRKL
ncbi:MAG: hypothetical protein JWR02_456 [Mucilaginibacter sp.]|nr:hypothetical protein [Mucilaginibacter sp.]